MKPKKETALWLTDKEVYALRALIFIALDEDKKPARELKTLAEVFVKLRGRIE